MSHLHLPAAEFIKAQERSAVARSMNSPRPCVSGRPFARPRGRIVHLGGRLRSHPLRVAIIGADASLQRLDLVAVDVRAQENDLVV